MSVLTELVRGDADHDDRHDGQDRIDDERDVRFAVEEYGRGRDQDQN